LNEKELRYYLNINSFVVTVLAVLAYFYLRESDLSHLVSLFLAFGVLTGFVNLAIYLLLKERPQVAFWISTILFDVVNTVMSIATGGIESRLPYLFVIPIGFSVYFHGIVGGVIQSAISLLVIFILSQLSLSHLGGPVYIYPSPITKNLSYFIIYTLTFGFFTAITGYLSSVIKRQEKDFLRYKLSSEELLNSVPSGIMTISPDGRVTFENRSAKELLSERERIEFLNKVLKSRGASRNEVAIAEKIIGFSQKILQDGTRIIVFQDLTDVKRLEEERKELEKLAFLGELAGNLAHEIRNPVQAIYLAMELLISKKVDGDPEFLKSVLKDAERLQEIVNRFLHYAKLHDLKLEEVNVSDAIENAFSQVAENIADGIKLENQVPRDYKVKADPGKLRELFANLFRNSIEAKTQGKIEVLFIKGGEEVELVDGEKFRAPWDTIIVRDYGEGMDEDMLLKAKELFFTTKKDGMGFGLAICDRIAKAQGWRLSIHSRKGKGTDVLLEVVGGEV